MIVKPLSSTDVQRIQGSQRVCWENLSLRDCALHAGITVIRMLADQVYCLSVPWLDLTVVASS